MWVLMVLMLMLMLMMTIMVLVCCIARRVGVSVLHSCCVRFPVVMFRFEQVASCKYFVPRSYRWFLDHTFFPTQDLQ